MIFCDPNGTAVYGITQGDVTSRLNTVGENAMDETGKEGPLLGLDEQCASQMMRGRLPVAVHVADMPHGLGKLLDKALEEHFHGR